MTDEQKAYIKQLETRAGRLSPFDVVEAAKPETSPIHDCFEWDDTTAADAYRLDQARELIRRVRIEITYEETTVRTVAYVRDETKDADETGYINLVKVKRPHADDIVKSEWERVLSVARRAREITVAKSADIENGDERVRLADQTIETINAII